MNRSNLGFLPVLTTAFASFASAACNTDFNYDDAGLLHAHDGTDTTNTGGTNDNVAGGQDNSGTPQSDSTEAGGQQQEQQASTDNAQQDQSNDAGQQANSTATETAAGKVDTDESVDGRQPE